MTIRVADIVESTATDGEGLRNALYVAGCDLHCPGCHNRQWWPADSGREMTLEEVYEALNRDDFNISILGGEPLMQYEAVLALCRMIKERTGKNIWLWTGHKYEEVERRYAPLLGYVDVIVDGPYVESLRDPGLPFRGSSNQRILRM